MSVCNLWADLTAQPTNTAARLKQVGTKDLEDLLEHLDECEACYPRCEELGEKDPEALMQLYLDVSERVLGDQMP